MYPVFLLLMTVNEMARPCVEKLKKLDNDEKTATLLPPIFILFSDPQIFNNQRPSSLQKIFPQQE